MSNPNQIISVPSALISPRAAASLTPAMTAVLWEIAAILDERRISPTTTDAVWLEVPARRLRGPGSQDNNRWLRICLERLTGLQIGGEYRGAPWGAVLIAEWHLERGEAGARLLITPAAVQALRAPATFARIETEAAHRLPGPAARLYAALADKKRLDRTWWRYELDELRAVLGVEDYYSRWGNLRSRILLPALKSLNAFGTVHVTMTPEKLGRRITAVRFNWRWKSLDEARRTAEETVKAVPYAEEPAVPTAPPLMPGTKNDRSKNIRKWWNGLPSSERETQLRRQRAGWESPRDSDGAPIFDEMPENFAAQAAWEAAHPDELPYDELPD